jgi:Mg-chelatase subunit ChlD
MKSRPLAYALLLTASACGTTDDGTSATTPSANSTGSTDAGTSSNATGSGSATGGGTNAGPSASSAYDDAGNQLCEIIKIDSGRVRPDMLLVLDRSNSMQGNGVDRWTPSVAGIKAITRSLDDRVDFGLMAFPGRGTGAVGTGQSCAAGTIEVPIGSGSAAAIANSLDGLQLVQSTPTAASLEAARTALTATTAQPVNVDVGSSPIAAKYVVLVTDGAPNCSNGTTGGTRGGTDAAAVDATVAAVEALAAAGVKTYVLGFGTKTDPTLAAALDRMAQAGGTGDTSHRAIEDEAQIVSEFQRIAGDAVTCEFALATPPEDPAYVAVTLDGSLLRLGDANGWQLSADRKRISVQGSSCNALKDPAVKHAISVEVRCTKVNLG